MERSDERCGTRVWMIVIGMLLLCVVTLTALQYIVDYKDGKLPETNIDVKKNNRPNADTESSKIDINSETNQNSTLKVDTKPA